MNTISPYHSAIKLHPQSPPLHPSHLPSPNLSLLKSCCHLKDFHQIHTQIIKAPSPQSPISLSKFVESLVNSSHLDYARQVFDEIPNPSTFVFNTMIRCHAEPEAILFYIQMINSDVEPDSFTYPFLLKSSSSLDQVKVIHSLVLKSGFGFDIYSQTSLVTSYSNVDDLNSARRVFDQMPARNVVSWSAMITGYVKHERHNDGLAMFRRMLASTASPNELTLVSVLSACAHLGAYEMGKWIHLYIQQSKAIVMNQTLGTTLIDMYAKCGHIHQALQVFNHLSERSLFTWNAMIGGLAMHGLGEEALEKFAEMQRLGIRPDDITLIGVLSACAHSGLVERGKECFYSMERELGIKPNIKHYGCLIDLLGRAGLLGEAYEIIQAMPMEPNGVVWGSLLNCCAVHGDVELAEKVISKLVELEPFNDGNYVLMSKIYASKGRWADVARVRGFMKERGIVKKSGWSSIEVGGEVHEFIVGCSAHRRAREIYAMLDNLAARLVAEGYVPKD